jgi:monofunctional biosynthetic peptidoglycan transglycosylase
MRRLRAAVGVLALVALGGAGYVYWGLPPREEARALARRNPGPTAVMRQREEEARKAKRTPRRQQTWVPLSRVSRHLIHAVLVAEDPKFFGHEGVDWEAVRESVEANVRKGRFARGGSTITQQLAKNLFFSTRKSLVRKLRELLVARWLEQDLTKKRILEIYLNVIEWGDGIYGVEAAAERYYGKPAADLTEVEAAGLAAMIPSPRRINPRVSPARHARAQKRILWLMARAGYVRREVAGLGSEPPPEPVEEADEEPLSEPAPVPAPTEPTDRPTAPAEASPAEPPPVEPPPATPPPSAAPESPVAGAGPKIV